MADANKAAQNFFAPMSKFLAINLVAAVLVGCSSSPSPSPSPTPQTLCSASTSIEAKRSPNNPLLDINTMPMLGDNVNGPSVVRVPDWMPNPLGKYYMYFASHNGDHIKLAYADQPTGPWLLKDGGTLQLSEATGFFDHIASPDVHVDNEAKQIRMYFHGPHTEAPALPGSGQQVTGVSFSDDGINFQTFPGILGTFYFRVFQYGGYHYAFAKNGNVSQTIYRSRDGITNWERGIDLVPNGRHVAVELDGDTLVLYFSVVGDAPEHIVRTVIDLKQDWRDWAAGQVESVLFPEYAYEGANYAVSPSRFGASTGVRELRDPAILVDEGRRYLFYSGAGEETINVAELVCAP